MNTWVPANSQAKYLELFQKNDLARTGFISAAQARVILLQSGLPQQTLAKIWDLADRDDDGALSKEEFILAHHLIDLVRKGESLPTELPPDLIPPSQRGSLASPMISPSLRCVQNSRIFAFRRVGVIEVI